MEGTISINDILMTLRKRIRLIITTTLLILILGALFTFFLVTPQYQASTQILINQNQDNEQTITSTELQSNRELINTYNVIITSPIILEKVIENLSSNKTVSELQNQITVTSEEQSQVVVLSVEDSDPYVASTMANQIAEVFEQEVPNIMNINNVSILSDAQTPDEMTPVSPQPLVNIVISLVMGVMIGIGIALLIEYFDQTIKTEQDVEKVLSLSVLGSISIIEKDFENQEKT